MIELINQENNRNMDKIRLIANGGLTFYVLVELVNVLTFQFCGRSIFASLWLYNKWLSDGNLTGLSWFFYACLIMLCVALWKTHTIANFGKPMRIFTYAVAFLWLGFGIAIAICPRHLCSIIYMNDWWRLVIHIVSILWVWLASRTEHTLAVSKSLAMVMAVLSIAPTTIVVGLQIVALVYWLVTGNLLGLGSVYLNQIWIWWMPTILLLTIGVAKFPCRKQE